MIRKQIIVLALAALPTLAMAQDTGHDDHDHDDMAGIPPIPVPHAWAWAGINARMHEGMAIDYTGDPDVDFVRAMIPHHQGAIEMAEYVLQHGQDPDVRALAAAVIAAQENEIAMMREWLSARGHE